MRNVSVRLAARMLVAGAALSFGVAIAQDDDPDGAEAASVLRELADLVDEPGTGEAQGNTPWRSNGAKLFYNAGNVGIGTGNPAHKLQVVTSGRRAIHAQSSAPNAQTIFAFSTSSTGSGWGVYAASRGPTGRALYGNAIATSGRNYGVFARTASPSGYAGYFLGGRNYFGGNVGIGTLSPAAALEVNGDTIVDGDLDVDDDITIEESLYLDPPGATTKGFVEYRIDNGRDYLSVGATGGLRLWADTNDVDFRHPDTNAWQDVRAASFTTQSTRRSKREIEHLDGDGLQACLEQVLSLQPATYQLKSDPQTPSHADRRRLGLIAEETPDRIRAGDGVDVYALVTTVAAATIALAREKDEQIRVQEAEIASLTDRVAELEALAARIEGAAPR